jgi:hypothetical protein
MMRTRIGLAGAMLACLLASGCATKAPGYQTSVDNVHTLAGLGPVRAAVGTVKLDEKNAESLNRLSARAMSIEPPYAGGYAEYLAEALRADLGAAGKLDPKAPKSINAVMTANNLDASGISTGSAEVAARFTVTERGRVLYDRQLEAKHEWESSFMGAIAVMNALHNYNVTVQKLVGQLFADPAFGKALR